MLAGSLRAEIFGWGVDLGGKCAALSSKLLPNKIDDYKGDDALDFRTSGGCFVERSMGS